VGGKAIKLIQKRILRGGETERTLTISDYMIKIPNSRTPSKGAQTRLQ